MAVFSLRAFAIAAAALLIGLPFTFVFVEALRNGVGLFLSAALDPGTLHAIKLTLLIALTAVPLNAVFGIAAAWAITRFEFPGKNILSSLIDLPFAVSPVIAGMIFVLLFGRHGYLGPWLEAHNIKIIFAIPGMILATVFVTFPFVARELIPTLQEHGNDDEEAALMLGASGWQTFIKVTLPNIKWALMYGIILSTARAVGEFGAVSVVSGHIRGRTITMPLHVESLYNEYEYSAAFAVASLSAVIAVLALAAKHYVGKRT